MLSVNPSLDENGFYSLYEDLSITLLITQLIVLVIVSFSVDETHAGCLLIRG